LGKRQNSGGGKLLTNLVTYILNDAVKILKSKDEEFPHTKPHFMNHIGDGFVLIVRGKKSPLVALLCISEFRKQANFRIENYQQEMKKRFAETEKKLPRLGFGIGAHFGVVVDVVFENFGTPVVGVLGSSINIASRVEQCTKDHDCNVIFTHVLLKRVLEIIPKTHQDDFTPFRNPLGKHRLRGIDEAYRLYDFEPEPDKPEFHKAWKSWKENRSQSH
jgi:class 3 adenylate cyclase